MSVISEKISRRVFLQSAFAASTVSAFGSAAHGDRRPNIIFILADDMGYGDTGAYGQKKFHTPTIDRLAREGVQFTDAYAGAPVCSPSRSTLMTGLNAGHTRVRDNFALAAGPVGFKGKEEIRRASLLPEDRTVADYLKQSGYHTGLVGKWHLDGYDPQAIPTRHGFDEFKGWLTQDGSSQGYFPRRRYYNEEIVEIAENSNKQQGRYETEIVSADAQEFIRRNHADPFFLYVAYSSPHSPYIAPTQGSYASESWDNDEKTYASMIEYMDRGIGGILDALKASGIEEQTIVFFASDNGPRSEPTEQQTKVVNFFDSNGILQGYKRDMYEGGIRDPLIVRWPQHVPAGKTCSVPTYFPDFLPTALDLADAPSQHSDGLSIKQFLLNPSRKAPDRILYWEFYEPEFRQAARWGRWKAVRLKRGAPLELYDLSTDPSEQHNIAAQHADVVKRLDDFIAQTHTPSAEYPDPQS
jgi:arylsulfatase A-like enzyme